ANPGASPRRSVLVLLAPSRYVPANSAPHSKTLAQRSVPVSFKLPPLPYAYDALAPHMSKETLEFHHTTLHQAYVDNGSKAIAGAPYESVSLEEICKKECAEKNAP